MRRCSKWYLTNQIRNNNNKTHTTINCHLVFGCPQQQEIDKDASSSINNVAVDEAVVTSSVHNEVEQPEKVCIDSDSDGDDDLIINNTIATEQQLKTADGDAGRLEFKTVSKKWCAYSNLSVMKSGDCYTLSFRKRLNLIWLRIWCH